MNKVLTLNDFFDLISANPAWNGNFHISQPTASEDQQCIKITMRDGTEFDEKDVEAWSKGDLSSIGLDRREPKIIIELAKIVVAHWIAQNSIGSGNP